MAIKQIIDITAPLLSSADYGRDVAQMVQNINYNFEVLANQAFVRGAPGDNTVLEQVVLHEGTDEWNQVISALGLSQDDKTINGVNSWDLMDGTSIYFICEEDNTDPDNPILTRISSLPYYFVDARFVNTYMSEHPEEYMSNPSAGQHELVINRSCVLVWKDTEFEKITGAFPVLDYDGERFVWNINGFNTGLSASGVQGIQGTSGMSLIVKFLDNGTTGAFQATQYMKIASSVATWVDITQSVIDTINDEGTNCIVFAMGYDDNDNPTGNIYISPMFKPAGTDDEAWVYCNSYNLLDLAFDVNKLISILNVISPSNALKGLYVPTGSGNNAHMLYDVSGELALSPVVNHSNLNQGLLSDKVFNINYSTTNVNKLVVKSQLISEVSNTLDGTTTISGDTTVTGNTTLNGNITISSDTVLDFEDGRYVENITYSALVTKRGNSQLIPGRQYRITDYITTTVQANTTSANHAFDIIVTAITTNMLSEQCRAVLHDTGGSGRDYFSDCKLNAWKIWYCLDNDTNRFAWADVSRAGRGVIYRMIDEFGNDCPYDFKNIKFRVSGGRFTFTFGLYNGTEQDLSVYQYTGGDTYPNCCYGNIIKPYYHYPNIGGYDGYPSSMQELNQIYFWHNISNSPQNIRVYCNVFEENCYNIKYTSNSTSYKFIQNHYDIGCHDMYNGYSGESGVNYIFFENCMFSPDSHGNPLNTFDMVTHTEIRKWCFCNGTNLIFLDPTKLTLNEE